MKPKQIIRCPECNSSNVIFWQEFNITKEFKIKKNGEPYKKPFNNYDTSSSMPYGYKCEDCNNFGYINDYEYKTWSERSDEK
jgi:ribosomal protein S27E